MKRVNIIAAMQGDETYGIDLCKAFIRKYPELKSSVQLIIGNERAYKEKKRFIDSDLNRHYTQIVEDYESNELLRLESLIDKYKPDYILDIHTTRRSSGVFFISDSLNLTRKRICAMLDIDICILKDPIVKASFIGNHLNAVSLEYSLDSISNQTTMRFVGALHDLINDTVPELNNSSVYEVKNLITYAEWQKYDGLQNKEVTSEGIALMVPFDESEMDAEYYGFWGTSKT